LVVPPALAALGQGLPLTHGIVAARDPVAGVAIGQVTS
jgi:hypothetical protein